MPLPKVLLVGVNPEVTQIWALRFGDLVWMDTAAVCDTIMAARQRLSQYQVVAIDSHFGGPLEVTLYFARMIRRFAPEAVLIAIGVEDRFRDATAEAGACQHQVATEEFPSKLLEVLVCPPT